MARLPCGADDAFRRSRDGIVVGASGAVTVHPSTSSVLKLMYAAVIRAADRWRGLTVGEFEQRQLRAIREELDRAHAERMRPAVRHIPSASPSKLSSKART